MLREVLNIWDRAIVGRSTATPPIPVKGARGAFGEGEGGVTVHPGGSWEEGAAGKALFGKSRERVGAGVAGAVSGGRSRGRSSDDRTSVVGEESSSRGERSAVSGLEDGGAKREEEESAGIGTAELPAAAVRVLPNSGSASISVKSTTKEADVKEDGGVDAKPDLPDVESGATTSSAEDDRSVDIDDRSSPEDATRSKVSGKPKGSPKKLTFRKRAWDFLEKTATATQGWEFLGRGVISIHGDHLLYAHTSESD